MRAEWICVLAVAFACSDTKTDTAGESALCPGDSISVEVCIDCGDAGGCDEVGYECRSGCESNEDCADGEECRDSDEGRFCDERYGCD